jgi:hypothetical protein
MSGWEESVDIAERGSSESTTPRQTLRFAVQQIERELGKKRQSLFAFCSNSGEVGA